MKQQVFIITDFIRLDALLKLLGVTQTGGQAKNFILEGNVKVNGELCLQRTKKVRSGDTVTANSKEYLVMKSENNKDKI